MQYCFDHVTAVDFRHEVPRQLFCLAVERLKKGERPDFISFAAEVDIESVSSAFQTLFLRRQRLDRALASVTEVIKRMKERNWLMAREEIRKKMENPSLQEEELVSLAREFDLLTKNPPKSPSLSE